MTDDPPKRYVHKTENKITACYVKLLMPETIKSLGRNERKISKDENGGNKPHLEIMEVVLVHGNTVNNLINNIHSSCIHSCIHSFLINTLVNY